MTSDPIAPIFELARQHQAAGRFDQAVLLYRQILASRPDLAAAANNLAKALHDQGDWRGAVAACRQCVSISPDNPQAHNNLGLALLADEQIDDSILSLKAALVLDPNLPDVFINLAEALRQKGQIGEAIAATRQALRLQPDSAFGHLKLGELLLLAGDFANGLPEYDWRYRVVIKDSTAYAEFRRRLWDGSNLDGRRIILGPEGGFGDVMQFVRYLPMVAERGGKIFLGCPPELSRLLQGFSGVEQLIPSGQQLPEFDVHSPLINLVKIFATTLETIPAKIPYLSANPILAKRWTTRLTEYAGGLKVGIAWAGSPKNRYERNRSLALSQLAPLANIPNITLFSLQKGREDEQIEQKLAGFPLVDWTAELHDFADTAALISNLDMVIAADTAVAHLAGAMGKPTWVLLPLLHDWRWFLNRSDSPWYPTLRLFRQTRMGDWDAPIQQMSDALKSTKKN